MTAAAQPLGAAQPLAAARAPGGIRLPYLALVVVELALLLLLLRQYQIENAAFLRLAALAFGGFVVHALLPLRYRMPFFAALSLCGIALVLGLSNGAWLVGLGLLLIGICHIPVSFTVRGLLLLAAGALLAAQRAKLLPFPWSEAIWPILGSMFMFRLIVYFYDLRHDNAPTSPARTAAYFFMLPNASFPLFPVIDYKAFRRNYYDADAYRIYQKGIDWMVRGVVHLILYRLIYYHWTLAPSEVAAPSQLLQYLVANFLLYLRVSGLFHLIVGMLHLYGFNLPETHNRYLLASSFTDFWRRINIYWKDFMQKVFYYPAVFRLKKLGTTNAIIVATLYVFLMTWFLHAYQWFWLRGSTLLVWQDILFWAILGVLVVINSLYEMTYGRRRSLGKQVWNWRRVLSLSARTFATFWFICILWSFWTAESLADWFSLWTALQGPYTLEVLLLPCASFLVILLGSIPRDAAKGLAEAASAKSPSAWLRERAVTVAALGLLIGVSVEGIHMKMGETVANTIHSLKSGRLSRLDTAKLERGYYESLLSVDRFNSQLWEVYAKKPSNWLDAEGANLKRFVGGFVQVELIPSYVYDSMHGRISINRWGMRDRDYEPQPGPETFRAIVLGPSTVMGWGVGDGETFEALLERRLNEEMPDGAFRKFELLNCGVPGYQPPQQLVAFERCMQFEPHSVMYVATGRELSRAASYLVTVARKGIEVPYGPLRSIVERAGLNPALDESSALRQLEPYRSEIVRFVYSHIAQQARARGVQPVWIFLPQVRDGAWREETPEAKRLAEEAGFLVINLEDVYKGLDINTIRLAEWDDHPNARGHQIVAERLFENIKAQRAALFAGNGSSR